MLYISFLLSLAAFFLCFFSLFYFKSYLKRRTGQERILSELRAEVNQILKSINETTERDISLIEDREKNLKNLLSDIDRRFNVYIREMEKRHESDIAYAELVSQSDLKKPEKSTYYELGKNRYGAGRKDISVSPISDENPPNPGMENPDSSYPLPGFKVKPETAPPVPQDTPSKNAQIHELIKAGLAPHIIASRLGISIAEVEFASALLERRADKL